MVKNTASNAVSTEANDFDPTIANEIVLRKEEFNEIRRKLSPQDEGFPIVEVVNYNEREEAIIIEVAIIIKANWVKRLLVVPLLSLLTIFIFPIFLYWRADMRAQWFYSTVQTLDDATNILIVGRGKHKSFVRANFVSCQRKTLPLFASKTRLNVASSYLSKSLSSISSTQRTAAECSLTGLQRSCGRLRHRGLSQSVTLSSRPSTRFLTTLST